MGSNETNKRSKAINTNTNTKCFMVIKHKLSCHLRVAAVGAHLGALVTVVATRRSFPVQATTLVDHSMRQRRRKNNGYVS